MTFLLLMQWQLLNDEETDISINMKHNQDKINYLSIKSCKYQNLSQLENILLR